MKKKKIELQENIEYDIVYDKLMKLFDKDENKFNELMDELLPGFLIGLTPKDDKENLYLMTSDGTALHLSAVTNSIIDMYSITKVLIENEII